METVIRKYTASDEPVVVELALRAWAPVFASIGNALGAELNRRLHGEDWQLYQEAAVRRTLDADVIQSWVAEADGALLVGFVSAIVRDRERGLGEIEMLAVDPHHQGSGIGTRLTEHATDWLRGQGMQVAMIETGGDQGHAAARATYEKVRYTAVPAARYFKAL